MGKKRAKAKTPVVGEKPFLHVQVRAFAHATEDTRKVQSALAQVAGFDLAKDEDTKRFEKGLSVMRSQGHFNNPITIFEVEIARAGEVRRFWDRLFASPGARERLAREVDERLDDDLVFWLRLDKQAAFVGETRLTKGEDVIQVRAKLATYPKDREVGLRFLQGFLGADLAGS
jgi:RNA-binding protein